MLFSVTRMARVPTDSTRRSAREARSAANLSVRDAGSLTTPGSWVYNLQITNRGTIGTGANISSSIGGDLTAGGVFASIDNSAGGRIGSGANIDWKVGGDVNVAGAAE